MKSLFAIFAVIVAFNLAADITYDGGQDTIVITGFSEDVPCSPWTLYLADKMNGWGRVSFDKTSGTYTVQSRLMVGDHSGSDTWFQIGSAAFPTETLVVKGDLTVFPTFITGLNPESDYRLAKPGRNVLVLGDPRDPNVKATLKLGANAGLSIGFIEELSRSPQYGGGMRVYNSRVTAEDNVDTARFGGRFIRFPRKSEIILRNAEISQFKSDIYSLGYQTSVENCVFAKGRGVILDRVILRDCTFENMDEAIYDFGGVDATLINCVFKNNKRNFCLRFDNGVNCVDCEIGEAATPDIVTAWRRDGKTIYPKIVSRRHVTVSVADAENNAVAGAKVTISDGVETIDSITGKDGATPRLLLREYTKQATDNAPQTTVYVYVVRVEKDKEHVELLDYLPQKGNTNIRLVFR